LAGSNAHKPRLPTGTGHIDTVHERMKCESALCHQVDYANTPMFGQTQTAQIGNTDCN
jgi:hypothetical protein